MCNLILLYIMDVMNLYRVSILFMVVTKSYSFVREYDVRNSAEVYYPLTVYATTGKPFLPLCGT